MNESNDYDIEKAMTEPQRKKISEIRKKSFYLLTKDQQALRFMLVSLELINERLKNPLQRSTCGSNKNQRNQLDETRKILFVDILNHPDLADLS